MKIQPRHHHRFSNLSLNLQHKIMIDFKNSLYNLIKTVTKELSLAKNCNFLTPISFHPGDVNI